MNKVGRKLQRLHLIMVACNQSRHSTDTYSHYFTITTVLHYYSQFAPMNTPKEAPVSTHIHAHTHRQTSENKKIISKTHKNDSQLQNTNRKKDGLRV